MLKYKCTVELQLSFPTDDDDKTKIAKNAIDELIDGYIEKAVFNEMCAEHDKVIVTRELLEYVDDVECVDGVEEVNDHTNEVDK